MSLRPQTLCALLFVAVPALSDRVVTVPTGYTLQPGEYKLEHFVFGRFLHDSQTFLQAGAMRFNEQFVEIQAVREKVGPNHDRSTLNLQYSINQPYPEYAPGLSVGVVDILNQSKTGIALFAATTFQFNIYSDWARRERASVTLGAGTRNIKGAFVGIVLPMFKGITFIGEHDSRVLTAGFQIEPAKGFALKALVRDNLPMFGFQVSRSF